MDQLKKHGFWIALGVLALVAGILYLVVVGGLKSDLDRKAKALRNAVEKLRQYASIENEKAADPAEGLPVKPLVDYWAERRQRLQTELGDLRRIYEERDQRFEHLLGANRRNEVTLTQFATEYGTAIQKQLQRPYEELLAGETAESVFSLSKPQVDDDMAPAQKRFNIASAIAAAAKGASAVRIYKVEFGLVEKAGSRSARPGRPGAPPEPTSAAIATRIEATAEILMPFQSLPKLVSGLLKSQQRVVLEITELSVEAAPFRYAELEPYEVFGAAQGSLPGQAGKAMRSFDKEVYLATADQSKEATKAEPPALTEPPVKVALKVQALDFEIEPENATK